MQRLYAAATAVTAAADPAAHEDLLRKVTTTAWEPTDTARRLEHLLMQMADVIAALRHAEEPTDANDNEAPDADNHETPDAHDNDTEVLDFVVRYEPPDALLLTGALPGLPPRDEWERTGFPPPADLDDF